MEIAALRAIFLETPELFPALERQFEASTVIDRLNSGGGFLTTIAVADNAPSVIGTPTLGYATHARVDGLKHGFGFVLFMQRGRLHQLDGFTWAGESTHDLDLDALQFELYHQPIDVIS